MNNAKENLVLIGKGSLKSILNSFPVGATAVAIYDELQAKQVKRKIERLEEFYKSLDERINVVEKEINHDYVNHEDFLDVFEKTTRYVVSERQAQKRELFRNILANSITAKDCDYDKTERYYRILDNLSEIELSVLAVLKNPEDYNRQHGMIIKDPINTGYQPSFVSSRGDGVLTQLLGISIDDATEAVTVLFSDGLIVDNLLNKRMESNTNPVHVLDHMLTRKGRDFVKFLKA